MNKITKGVLVGLLAAFNAVTGLDTLRIIGTHENLLCVRAAESCARKAHQLAGDNKAGDVAASLTSVSVYMGTGMAGMPGMVGAGILHLMQAEGRAYRAPVPAPPQ